MSDNVDVKFWTLVAKNIKTEDDNLNFLDFKQRLNNLRSMIDGCLNRMNVSSDMSEINSCSDSLDIYLSAYRYVQLEFREFCKKIIK